MKEFIVKIFGTSALQFFSIDIDEAAFHLGSFIYPKYMIKCLNEEFGNDTALTAQEKADNQQKVLNIYYFSYKFSLERLQILINEPRIMMFVIYYAQYTRLQRIHEKSNMEVYKAAYYEALEAMINHSS